MRGCSEKSTERCRALCTHLKMECAGFCQHEATYIDASEIELSPTSTMRSSGHSSSICAASSPPALQLLTPSEIDPFFSQFGGEEPLFAGTPLLELSEEKHMLERPETEADERQRNEFASPDRDGQRRQRGRIKSTILDYLNRLNGGRGENSPMPSFPPPNAGYATPSTISSSTVKSKSATRRIRDATPPPRRSLTQSSSCRSRSLRMRERKG